MATVAQPGGGRVLTGLGRATTLSPRVALSLGLGALALVSILVRVRHFGTGFWIDEGLSVGIADRPLSQIPGALRLDGSPPLYYVVLHGWLALGNRSEAATHALSLVFALGAIPLAFFIVDRLWGRRAAWFAGAIAALVPFLNKYAQETRMYALVVVLGLVGCAAFAQVFAHRRRRGWLPAFSVAIAALLYTHNWSVFFVAACGATWLGLVMSAEGEERRALLRDGLLGFGGAFLLYAPWLPTLIFQSAHTGAPWAKAPGFTQLRGSIGQLLGHREQDLLLIGVGAGALALRRVRGPEARALVALTAIGLGTVVLAWLSSQVNPAWAIRYLAIALPPAILVCAGGLARGGRLGLIVLAMCMVGWLWDTGPSVKSNVHDVAQAVAPGLRPGDLVLSTQPEQVPVLRYYLGSGLRWATLTGALRDTGVTDWRDGPERLARTDTQRDLRPLLDALPVGHRLVLVEPTVYDLERWSAPWTELVRVRSAQWRRTAQDDSRFRTVAVYPESPFPPQPNAVRATVLLKLRSS